MITQEGGDYLNALKDFSGSSSSSGKKPLPSQSKGTSSTFDLFKKNK